MFLINVHKVNSSLRSRRLEVVGTEEKTGAREGDIACLPLARQFSLSPTTSKLIVIKWRLSDFFSDKLYMYIPIYMEL